MPTRIVANRADLAKALAALKVVTVANSPIPILKHVLITPEPGRIALRVTDQDVDVRITCPAEVAGCQAETCPVLELSNLVGSLPDGAQVELTIGDKGRMAVRAGRVKASLPTLPPAEFPQIRPEGTEVIRFEMPAAVLFRLMTLPATAISTEATRYYLNGIYLHPMPDLKPDPVMRAVSTDGHRMIRIEEPMPAEAAGMPGIIVPRNTRKLIAERIADAEDTVAVAVSATSIAVTHGDWSITSKLIDGTFPEYERNIPLEFSRVVSTGKAELAQMLRRAAGLAEEQKTSKLLALDIMVDGIRLWSNRADGASIEDELDALLKGTPITIGFNSRYLLDALSVLDSENVEIRMNAPDQPAMLARADGKDLSRLVIVMPMHVGKPPAAVQKAG